MAITPSLFVGLQLKRPPAADLACPAEPIVVTAADPNRRTSTPASDRSTNRSTGGMTP
jgi:hypothetical protein